MKNTNDTFKIGENRVIKVMTSNSFNSAKMHNLIEDIDNYIYLEYNVFSKSADNDKLDSFCKKITAKLDESNPTSFNKLFVKIFGILAISSIAVFQIYSLFDDFSTTLSTFQSIIPNTTIQISLSLLLIGVVVYFFLTESGKYLLQSYIPNFGILENIYSKTLNKKIKENSFNLSAADFLEISKKWFKKEKKYLFIVHFPNWADFSSEFNALIGELMKRHSNIKLIYTHEDGENDYIPLHGIDINDTIYFDKADEKRNKIYDEVLHLKLKFPEITNIEVEEIKLKKLNEIEIYLLYKMMIKTLSAINPETVSQFSEILKSIGNEDELAKVVAKKNQITEKEIFVSRVEWDKLDNSFKKFYLLIIFYYYYFRKPLAGKQAIQMSFIFKAHKIFRIFDRDVRRIINALFLEHTGELNNEFKEFEELIEDNFDSFAGIVKYDGEKNEYFIEDENEKYIDRIVKNNNLIKDYDIENFHSEFAKYFLLYIFKSNNYFKYESEFKKLLLYIPEESMFFKILVSDTLLKIPFQADNQIGSKYEKGITFAKEIWNNKNCKYFEKFSFKIFDIEVDLIKHCYTDPFYSLMELLKYSIEKESKLQIEELLQMCERLIVSDKLREAYPDQFSSFCQKFELEKLRYQFYIDTCNPSDLYKISYLSLIYEIEKKAFILLPQIMDFRDLINLPVINCEDLEDLENNDQELLFLIILSNIHNNYYLISNDIYPRNYISLEEAKIKIATLFDIYEYKLNLLESRNLNYRDYNYHILYRAKGYLLFQLLSKLNIVRDSRCFDNAKNITPISEALFLFENFENTFLIVDLLFWKCWFNARIHFEAENLENDLYRLFELIEKKLHYIHYDNGLIYIGVISNSIIPPETSYYYISNFLKYGDNIPAFIELQMLNIFSIITFNGMFMDKSQLMKECLQTLDTIKIKFGDVNDKRGKTRLDLMRLSIYMEDIKKYNEDVVNHLLESLWGQVDLMEDSEKGEFFSKYLGFLFEKQEFSKIVELDLYEKTRSYLKNSKFYYLQFLSKSIQVYYDVIFKEKIDELNESINIQITEYNRKVEERNLDMNGLNQGKINRADGLLFIPKFDPDRDAYNDLFNEQSNIELKQDELNKMIKKDSLYRELETEFEEYYAIAVKNHPHKYLFAIHAKILAGWKHSTFSIQDASTIRYYKIALKLYYELREYSSFLRISLELKFLKWSLGDVDVNKMVFEVLDYFYSNNHFDVNDNKNELANLLYDFINISNFNSREDYSYGISLEKRINEDSSFRINRDSRGIRFCLTSFYLSYYNRQYIDLDKSLSKAIGCAKEKIEAVTYDDILHLEKCLDMARRLYDSLEWLEKINTFSTELEMIRTLRGEKMYTLLKAYEDKGNI